MQLLAEAPAVTADTGDGVVAEVELVQGREAVERAAVHFHQAVVLQMPAMTSTRRVTMARPRDTPPSTAHTASEQPLGSRHWSALRV